MNHDVLHEVLVFASVTADDIPGFELEFSVFRRFDSENDASGKYIGVRWYVLFENEIECTAFQKIPYLFLLSFCHIETIGTRVLTVNDLGQVYIVLGESSV